MQCYIKVCRLMCIPIMWLNCSYSTAAADVFKLTMPVDGVSLIKCAVEHQLLVYQWMEQILTYKYENSLPSAVLHIVILFTIAWPSHEPNLRWCMSTVGSTFSWNELSTTSTNQSRYRTGYKKPTSWGMVMYDIMTENELLIYNCSLECWFQLHVSSR